MAAKMSKRHQKILEGMGEELDPKAICREAADYLDYNELTNIGSGSALHKKLREAGGPTPKQVKTYIHNPEGAMDAHDFNCAIEGSGKCNCSQKRPKQVKAKGQKGKGK